MRTLAPALISNCYRTLAKSLNFPDWPGADEEKESLVKKNHGSPKHKRPRGKIKYSNLKPGKSL